MIQVFGDVLGKRVMLGMDEPEHGGSGRWCRKRSPRRRWRAGRMRSWGGRQRADRWVRRSRQDGLGEKFTFPYPTQIIAGLLGLPRKDYPQFQRWSISLLSFTINPERGKAASEALAEYFAPILGRRADPRDDLISGLAEAEIDGQRLSDEEIFSFLRLLLPAGAETTYRSMGNLLFALLTNPDQLDAVRNDRNLLPQAIEEAVRWEPPLLTITRVANRDTELGGVPIPAGSSVMPMLGSANRQEDRYGPGPVRHLPRSQGPHRLGARGTRMPRHAPGPARDAHRLQPSVDRLPNLRMDPDGDDPHIRGQVFRSPTSLPVLFDASGAWR